MNKPVFKVVGILILIISALSFILPLTMGFPISIAYFINAIPGFVLGILYLSFGFGKFRINKLSNISLGLSIGYLVVSLIGTLIIFSIVLTQMDSLALLIAIPISVLSGILFILALIFLIISMFKK